MRAMVSPEGRVIIPKALRTRLGIRAGTVLAFEVHAGTLVARIAQPHDPIDQAWGILTLDESADEFIGRLRGGRP
jgi:AbrB family looped-hinge helix DNA binding protein